MSPRRLLAALLLAAIASGAWPQETLEIITLRHRTAEDVLPLLRPLLEPGGALTGQYGQLIVRASPGNLAEIRRTLDVIDRPPRRLQISVRLDASSDVEQQAIEARGTAGRRTEIAVRAEHSRSASGERVDQRIQVVEGGRAYIATGQSRPLPQRQVIRTPGGTVVQETTVMHDIATGFYVIPRLVADRVELEIAQMREVDGGQPGRVQSQHAASTVSARLGEWFELGGTVATHAGGTVGLAGAGRSSATEARRIWVKVEETPN